MPNLQQNSSDINKRRFLKQSFEAIKALFENGLKALSQQNSTVEHDLSPDTATDFRAEIFVSGKSRCYCRVWVGGMYGGGEICYSEQRSAGNACNEIISLSDNKNVLSLSALMSMGFTSFERTLDTKQLTQDQAANYLWHRFVAPLERNG